MRCLVCGKTVGPIRRLFDRKYCCDRHRRTAQRLSARALRDAQDFDDVEEPWLITPVLREEKRRRTGSGIGPASGILLVVMIIFVALVAPPGQAPGPAAKPKKVSIPLSERLLKMLPGAPSVDYRDDFASGVADWVGGLDAASRWARKAGKVEVGELRIWKPTLEMVNYQMVFQAQIESRAMSWAFRASDADNYYATKIAVPGPGGPARPEIIRYVAVNGERQASAGLPLPIALAANTPYRIRLRVKGNEFRTTINGQVVDVWRDSRHAKGGVGFFSDPGEQALVSWVRVTDGEGLFERLPLFTLTMGPHALPRPPF